MSTDPSVHTFLILDAERSRARANQHWQKLRDDLHVVLTGALLDTGIRPEMVEDRGGGALVVFRQPALNVLDKVIDSLVDRLSEVNASASPQDCLRLRFAIHTGPAHQDQQDWSGAALEEALELNSLPPVKALLRAADRAQCVVVVSDEVYRQVVCQRHKVFNPAVYRKVMHDDRVGWVMVPGYPAPPDPDPKPRTAPRPTQQLTGNIFNIDTVHNIDARVSPYPAGDQ